MQVLIVEDDIRLAQALGQILKENHYQVDLVHDGDQGFAYAESRGYDVIILDVMLPRKSGLEVVTARTTVQDKITGLDSGADDYVTKPFSPAELLAHLRALTRRQGQIVFEKIDFGDISLNLESHDLSCGSKSINLSYKEFSIANILISSKGQIVSKDMLISKVWGVESSAVDNNVEAYISFLRKKLTYLCSQMRIACIRNVGYRLEEPLCFGS